MSDWSQPIVVEQVYQAAPERVWKALTVRDEMVEWYFDGIPDFTPEVGFETRFMVSTGEREFDHIWTVTEVAEHRRIAYRWRYGNYEGDGHVTFDLTPAGDGTKLSVTAEVREPFLPADLLEFQRESGVEGWKYFLQGQLKSYLDGR